MRGTFRLLAGVHGLLLLSFAATAQIPPVKPAPLSQQVPQGSGACSVEKSCADLAPAMIQSAMGPSPLEENLRYLTDTIGGRVTGTPSADRAADWGVQAFRHAGVDDVHTEKFTIPAGWTEGHTHLEILSPTPFPVRLVSIGWSPATPEAGITADVVDAGMGDDVGFAKAGASAKDAIVLIHSNLLVTWHDLDYEYAIAPAIIDRALKAGAVAVLWMSSRPNLLLYRHTLGR